MKEEEFLREISILESRFTNELLSRMHNRQTPELFEALDPQIERMGIDQDIINTFRIGYIPHRPTSLLKGIRSGVLSRAGVARWEERWIFPLSRRIVIPITNVYGNTVAFSGRRTGEDEESPKYINSPEHEWFKKCEILYGLAYALDFIRKNRRVFIVEGYSDVWLMRKSGYPETVAACGTSLTEYHVHLLRLLGVLVYLMFDGDQAGHKADEAAQGMCRTFMVRFESLTGLLPEGDDPASYLLRGGRFTNVLPI